MDMLFTKLNILQKRGEKLKFIVKLCSFFSIISFLSVSSSFVLFVFFIRSCRQVRSTRTGANKGAEERIMMDTSSATSNNNNSRQVILEGGLPWGFRIQGGSDTGVQLRIARVSILNTGQSITILCALFDLFSCFYVCFTFTVERVFNRLGRSEDCNVNQLQKKQGIVLVFTEYLKSFLKQNKFR